MNTSVAKAEEHTGSGTALSGDTRAPVAGKAAVTRIGGADRQPLPTSIYLEPARTISAEEIELAQRRAHALRAQAMQDMFAALSAWFDRIGRRLAARLALRSHEPRRVARHG